MSASSGRVILEKVDIERILFRMSHQILESPSFNSSKLAIIGVQTRGYIIAKRIQKNIQLIEKLNVDIGSLDISLHRDDILKNFKVPRVGPTRIPFNIDKKDVILVDDVLFTGRTVRAALDEIMDFGRPDRVTFAVLIDRGHRELPIKADIVGKNIPTHEEDRIKVHLIESDQKEEVILL